MKNNQLNKTIQELNKCLFIGDYEDDSKIAKEIIHLETLKK